MRFDSFRMCCQKVLPLVYDDSLSYYEMVCKLIDYMNKINNKTEELESAIEEIKKYLENELTYEEVSKKLDEMAKDGTLYELMAPYFNRLPLYDICDYKVIAQVIYDDVIQSPKEEWLKYATANHYGSQKWHCQASAISNDGVMLICCTQGVKNNTTDGIAMIYNFNTGNRIKATTGLSLGHANGACYCEKDDNFYIACGGGENPLSQIAVYTKDLAFVKNIDTTKLADNNNCYGIAYNKKSETFYLAQGGNINAYDSEFTRIKKSVAIPSFDSLDGAVVGQSLYCDDDYLYFMFSQTELNVYNGMLAFDIDSMVYKGTTIIPIALETESGFYYNGKSYALHLNNFAGVITEIYPIKTPGVGVFKRYSEIGSKIPSYRAVNWETWVDVDATNFFVKNTKDLPFNRYYHSLLLTPDSMLAELVIHLKGDCRTSDVNFKRRNQPIYIIGDNKETTLISGAFFSNVPKVRLYNLNFASANVVAGNASVSLFSVNNCNISNCIFSAENITRHLNCFSGNVNMSSTDFKTEPSEYNIYCQEGGNFRALDTKITYVGGGIYAGGFQYNGGFYPPSTAFKKTETPFDATVFGGSDTTVDLLDINQSGLYRFEASTGTVKNKPTGFPNNSFCLLVLVANSNRLYIAWNYSHNKTNNMYIANDWMDGTSSSLDWLLLS